MNEIEKLYAKIVDNKNWEPEDLDKLLTLVRTEGYECGMSNAKQIALSPWVSVNERLPDRQCLCLTKGFAYAVLWYRGGKFYSVLEGGYEISISGITHWMLIPKSNE